MRKLLFALLVLATALGYAHAPNQSYVFLRIYETNGIEGHYEINIKEINTIFNLDLPKDATLETITPYKSLLEAYVLKNAAFKSELGAHQIHFDKMGILPISSGNYVQLYFKLEQLKTIPDHLDVFYNIGFNEDPDHKGFLIMEYNWKAGLINNEANIALDFSPDAPNDRLNLSESTVFTGFIAMIKQGVWHIWIGIDHILFLLALILPAVVKRKNDSIFGWTPVMNFKTAFLFIIKVVSFFTIAHTITLTLAALQLINLPSQVVESIIAFSIGLAAYHNIKPIFKMKDWTIAFIFGLFHGFGFASVLSDLGLTSEFLSLSLLGFNIGVELGQLAIIAAIFPILYLIRQHKLYPKLLVYMSVLLIIISLYWCIERAFDINLKVGDYITMAAYETAKFLGLK